ncbi:hypothetical protein GETHLI_29890 [Geothrix limicola]|uniref:Uncharacterized protein n=1 Tax=Geothrix limicola TaxID=2927978 RepID=A0ABQ5QIG4_9BACT|nr:hypothetical protein [Geothrix limicola]GLH74487.1 hypothetical protein GETHLI_29890 [Geothrix limicola]
MLLGTAVWAEGPLERRALVGRLASGRLADLNRIEAVRLRKLGEGDPERLAEVLAPASLRRALEGGPRALARLRQTLAYAEKWDRRGTLPPHLAPETADLLPCLPRPASLRRLEGLGLGRFEVRGSGAELSGPPQPSLAVVGLAGGGAAGFCLALEDADSAILGAWMSDVWPSGNLELRVGGTRRAVPLKAWEGLELPPLRAGEVLLLPPPRLKPLPDLLPGAELRLGADFDQLVLRLGPEGVHPTVQ